MKAHLETLAAAHPNFHLRHLLQRPPPRGSSQPGLPAPGAFVGVALFRLELGLKPYHFYRLWSRRLMMETLIPALEDWGVPAARILFEAFGPASIKRQAAGLPVSAGRRGSGDRKRHQGELCQIRPASRLAGRHGQPARICRSSWYFNQFRLPSGRLRELPDPDRIRRGVLPSGSRF
jgi:ferredoxin-NADP reductase